MENTLFRWDNPSQSCFDADGRIQPLNCKKGELSNRIITVGDPNRALKISQSFDKDFPVIVRKSNMQLTTYTGKKNGVLISVVGTGMGFTMVDLLVTQARAILEGPIYLIRFGTCGSLHADVPVGCFAISNKAYGIRQSYENEEFPYELSTKPFIMDEDLMNRIYKEFTESMPQYRSVIGPVWSADTFYGSQGRQDSNFISHNENVISKILEIEPESLNFEMETYILAFLGHMFPQAQLRVGAVCITLAQRTSGAFLSNEEKYTMECTAADALLKILSDL
ncbi:Phosphorylase family protein [Trichomonas vaginalis G3]|uniref:Phosphorylase family protein n=1 Tax=Trichomonas vaginalis (strain ATCC PRA-98 / G3) TaxID=412133 RepID=A2EQ02_TRIV3|nr:phosphorylase superfamily [Trichomonas vaginalis G3]EAY05267.1 Phosphorylase family protein [Trichomonas vaginalis G3]KAI5530462.1 phosphorylase superfamily [Trichomonas vaginalis G3]|eukprot:XP_001317490.1 Phosphorylase family protein [Trichomonas vaginalis G3]